MTEDVKNVVEAIDSMIEELKMYMEDGESDVEEAGDYGEDMDKQESSLDAIMAKVAAGEPLSEEETAMLATAVDAAKSRTAKAEDASSDADERVGEVGDISEEAMSAVKALLARKGRQVKKSQAQGDVAALSRQVQKLAEVVGQVAKSTQSLQGGYEDLLRGIGLGEDMIQKSAGGAKKDDKTPHSNGGDVDVQIAQIRKALGLGDVPQQQSGPKSREDVRKDLKGAMGSIFTQR